MSSPGGAYTTKELTIKTWPDFERLSWQGNGWDFCWCMHFQRPQTLPKNRWQHTRADQGLRNRWEKKEPVEQGHAHGILIYANGEPVGWCQYGPREELPRIDNERHYRALRLEDGEKKLWRITCFVTDKMQRRRGIATLRAALAAIRKRGGGVVELIQSFHGRSCAVPECVAAGMLRRLEINPRTEPYPCSKNRDSRWLVGMVLNNVVVRK
jgi:hypothetical protein